MYAIYGNIYHILPSIYPLDVSIYTYIYIYIPYMDPMGYWILAEHYDVLDVSAISPSFRLVQSRPDGLLGARWEKMLAMNWESGRPSREQMRHRDTLRLASFGLLSCRSGS